MVANAAVTFCRKVTGLAKPQDEQVGRRCGLRAGHIAQGDALCGTDGAAVVREDRRGPVPSEARRSTRRRTVPAAHPAVEVLSDATSLPTSDLGTSAVRGRAAAAPATV